MHEHNSIETHYKFASLRTYIYICIYTYVYTHCALLLAVAVISSAIMYVRSLFNKYSPFETWLSYGVCGLSVLFFFSVHSLLFLFFIHIYFFFFSRFHMALVCDVPHFTDLCFFSFGFLFGCCSSYLVPRFSLNSACR